MKTVSVKFNTSSTLVYDYMYNLKAPIAIGDYVVVDSPHSGLSLVRVVGIKESGGTKFVVSKVDLTEYEEAKAKAAKIKDIKATLDKRIKQLESTLKYKMLASIDPASKELADELIKLEYENPSI